LKVKKKNAGQGTGGSFQVLLYKFIQIGYTISLAYQRRIIVPAPSVHLHSLREIYSHIAVKDIKMPQDIKKRKQKAETYAAPLLLLGMH